MSLRLSLAATLIVALVAGCAPTPAPSGEAASAAATARAGTAFDAVLSGGAEVPPVASQGKGSATLTLERETRTLRYAVEYSGLTGPLTAAHLHGPAGPGANAPPVAPIAVGPSPMEGTTTLTEAQVADLEAGLYYVNLHTAAHPGGEIRGQVAAAR
jgi:hypothetical protein